MGQQVAPPRRQARRAGGLREVLLLAPPHSSLHLSSAMTDPVQYPNETLRPKPHPVNSSCFRSSVPNPTPQPYTQTPSSAAQTGGSPLPTIRAAHTVTHTSPQNGGGGRGKEVPAGNIAGTDSSCASPLGESKAAMFLGTGREIVPLKTGLVATHFFAS